MDQVKDKISKAVQRAQVCALSDRPIPLGEQNVVYWQFVDDGMQFALLEEWDKQDDTFKQAIADRATLASAHLSPFLKQRIKTAPDGVSTQEIKLAEDLAAQDPFK
jgi:hypothetical protein